MILNSSNVFNKPSEGIVNKEFIDKFLYDLNQELVKRDKHLSITIYGGSSLCLLTEFRDSTYDIDTISSDKALLVDCLKSINVSGDIVNDDISAFINTKESLQTYGEYSNLTAKLPTLEYLLALKVRACRDKDLYDCVHLSSMLGLKTIDDFKSIFIKFYTPIMFNARRIDFCKKVMKGGK